ncbi:MAG TPA: fasciclin domain-containing protein, partial [Phototrophicaceae bacterium]|nr:fasciclin domain-containing protein [Phototrophicaceae bacterium]
GIIHTLDGVMLPPDVAAALATPEVTAAPSEEATEMATVAPATLTAAAPMATPEATVAPTAEATQEAGAPAVRPNIIDTLKADPAGRYTTLIAALDAAGLTDTIASGGPFTLLAPTDDAFAALEKQTGMTQDQLLADKQTLSEILTYHVLLGQHFFRTLTGGSTLNTLLQGQPVTFSLDNGVFTAQGANISDADTLAGNGIIDTLDSVMLPPDVVAAIATPEVTAAPTEEATPAATPTAAPTEEATPEATAAVSLPANSPHVRFVNLSTDVSDVDISLSASSSQNNLGFGTVTSWVQVDAGTYQINVTKSDGGTSIGTVSADLALGDYDTIAITGSSADNTLLVNVLHENYGALATGKARLSVFNGVHGSSSYNVVLSGRTVIILLGYPGTQGANDGFYNIDLKQGTYDVRFVLNRDGTTVIDLPNMKLEAGFNYFIAAAGASAQPGAVTSVSGVPAQ